MSDLYTSEDYDFHYNGDNRFIIKRLKSNREIIGHDYERGILDYVNYSSNDKLKMFYALADREFHEEIYEDID